MCTFFSKENISSEYLEELGKREGSLPPDYLALLKVCELTKYTILCRFSLFLSLFPTYYKINSPSRAKWMAKMVAYQK